MTANQISYASVNESIRHNTAMEEETKRHNLATEGLQSEINAINREKNQLEMGLGAERNRIQEEYNKAYLNWSRAQGTRKLELEQQMNEIQARKQLTDAQYQTRLNEINAMRTDIMEREYAEKVRNDQAMETINTYSTMVNENLKLKELEYKQHALDIESGLKRQDLEIKFGGLLLNEFIQTQELGVHQTYNDLMSSKIGSEINRNQEEIRFMPFNAFGNFIRNTVSPLMH